MNTLKKRLKVMYLFLLMVTTGHSQTFIPYTDFIDAQYDSRQNTSGIDFTKMETYLKSVQPKLYIINGIVNDRTQNGTLYYAEVDTSSIKQLLSERDTNQLTILTLRITKNNTTKAHIADLQKLQHLQYIHLICDNDCSFQYIKSLFSDSRRNYLIIYSIITPEQ